MSPQHTGDGQRQAVQPAPPGAAGGHALSPLDQAEQLRLLQAIVEAEPECVKLLGPDGSLRFINPAGLQMVEADTFDQVKDQCVYSLVDEQHRAAYRALTERVFRGESGSLEFRFTGLKGTPRWLETHAVPLRDHRGTVTALLGLTRDITDRKLADRALHESEQNLRTIFEHAIDAILVCDDDLRILDVNPAACEMTGYIRDELIGQVGPAMIDAPERSRLPQELVRLETGEAVTSEWRARRKDGTLFLIEVRVKRLPDGRYLAFGRDVTERAELQAQLLEAQKMETVGRLAGGVAHDFNNLLTVINGTVDFVLAGPHASNLRADLEQIRHAGERAAALTQQLVATSRQQILQPEALDLNAVVVNLQGELQRLIGEGVTLQLTLGEPLGHVLADPSQLEQVILNLAINARDAMPEGGRLTIETRQVAATEPAHRPLPPGPYVMLAVHDTGVGMDESARRLVFEPFFTTKAAGKGAGLGLSTVHGIIQQSGGTVWVDSRAGAGTTFTVYLPQVEAGPERLPPVTVRPPTRGHETILLVEDERSLRGLAKRILRSAGYQVIEASDAAEALQQLDQFDGDIHLLLTDIVMPGMNGRELATRVVSRRPDIKVLYMSGYTTDALVRKGVGEATNRLLAKPFTSEDLQRYVRETLDS
jgi:PAS domain S-box-containing protein